MKIGIVTTYDEINFGAFLQAYSLQKYIESLGHDVELINYKSNKYKMAELWATYKIKDPVYLFKTISKSIKFTAALKDMKISKKYPTIEAINNANYDVIVFGSDEIWNLNNCLGGIIDTYYFGENIRAKKISYAASFGSTNFIDTNQNYIKESLQKFESISVRDKNSENIMKSIGYLDTTIVLDPTFLIEQKVNEQKIDSKYIFYYCVSNNKKLDEEVLLLSKKLGFEVIAFGYKHKTFKNIISIDPFDWLGYLKKSEYVVTNMFHGTIFSIKYKKKFLVEMTEYRENKLGFLLDMFKLRDRIYKIDELEKTIMQEIDYTNIFEKISEMKKISTQYIKKAIS